ncbi:hypothetical protein [Nakamurella sp. PAMC28650]|uniref:hypothetical protein n=1 Tax=Nakamurella sp. PAMC28650 TaxID=2762325 RepID=UPI00164DEDFA|nr:hypothetical protein [Nakamurella sp. PAMC28650]QNK82600.1 hypothetical protein H7F38_07800 [Nakamurella sp. PAMC28650]
MSQKFIVRKHVSLDFLGEDWKEAFIDYNAFDSNDLLQISEISTDESDKTSSFRRMLELLKANFLDGKGVGVDGLVDLTQDDLSQLPIEIVNRSIEALNGSVSPN